MKKHKFIILAVLLPILLLSGYAPVSNARTEIAAEQQQEEETASDPSPAIDDELKKRLDDGKFEYEVDDGSITITKYTGTAASVTIPHGVTSIGMKAFSGCENLTSVTIPDSVTSIGLGAFICCKSLTSVTIPDSVTTIGGFAFGFCRLISVTIPESVTTIGKGTFGFCTSLTSVTIPDSVTNIGPGAFFGCKSLTIYGKAGSEAENYAKENKINFQEQSSSSMTTPTPANEAPPTEETGSVTHTPENPMSTRERLEKELERNFRYTIIGDSVMITEYTGTAASVTIPHGVTIIGMEAFRGCENLTSVTIPDSVTNIGPGAFFGCKSLTSVTIPDSVTSIKTGAFTLCESLTSVTIPDSVTTIDSGPFGFCSKLTEIRVSAGNTHFKSEDGILFTADRKTLVQVPAGKGLTEYTIPDSVTTIGGSAFGCCESLTSVTIPDSVTTIREGAFSCCTSLTFVTIPDSVTTIGGVAFNLCLSLTSVTIPESVTTIGERAFEECNRLTIYGKAGSEAERYAKEKGTKFQVK
ncbi:MAG: leucine-rich repeat domain-containing protein [Planctomycetaceae bacterium]|nr:leucine-rich repeat domain-containing protein [Planctomycetaceae bacterium]